jgi:hypothetical protein
MKKTSLILTSVLGFIPVLSVNGAITLANFNGTSFSSVAAVEPNASVTALTQAGGLTVFSLNASGYYDARSSTAARTGTVVERLDAAFKGLDYFSFTITADTGYELDISAFSFNGAKGGSSSRVIGIASSVDNDFSALALEASPNVTWLYSLDPGTTNVSNVLLNATDPGVSYQGLNSLTFLFAVDGDNALRFDNLVVSGDVSPVPEPSTMALILGFVTLACVGIRRRLKDA